MEKKYTKVTCNDNRIIGVKITTLGQEKSNLIYCLYLICDNECDATDIEKELDDALISFNLDDEALITIKRHNKSNVYIKFAANSVQYKLISESKITHIASSYIYQDELFFNPDLPLNK